MSKSSRQKAAKARKKEKKQRQKEKNMFGFGWNKNKNGGVLSSRPQVPEVLGTKKDNLNIVLFKQSTLNKIGDLCTPVADRSEFQVHYRSMQFIFTEEQTNKRVIFTIPTVFFNMTQKVTSISVKFTFDEVAEMSQKVSEISQTMAQSFIKAFPVEFFKAQGFTVEAREAEIGSIHRHPSRSGFSSTDLTNATKNPGIIFRTVEAEDRIQVDSVIYVNNNVELVVTETRLINVKDDGNEGIEGTYERIPTLTYMLKDETRVEDFGHFFGQGETKDFEYKVDKNLITKTYENIEGFLNNFLKNIDYDPILIIDPNLISQEYSPTANRYSRNYGYHQPSRYTTVGNSRWGDDWEDDGLGYDYETSSDGYTYIPHSVATNDQQEVSTGSPSKPFRPTWRKVQALGELTKFGIDVNNSSIDGTASVKDVKSIMAAFDQKKIDIPARQNFFKRAVYPDESLKEAGYDPITLKKL
jgi:hypothetical protein